MKNKYLVLLDYESREVLTKVNLYDPNVKRIHIEVITGDETASVEYYDGKKEYFDSSDCRDMNFFDYSYDLLDRDNDIYLIDEFLGRKDSYSMGKGALWGDFLY